MSSRVLSAFLLVLTCFVVALPGEEKPRVVVLTDISNEPDDEESLVRYLVYSNEFDTEALIATTSTWLKTHTREELIRRDIEAYAKVRPNLLKHAAGFPAPEELLKVAATGQPGYGMAFVGADKSSEGSKLLIQVVDKSDPRPVWVTVWGGANTLAQALWDVRASRSQEELARFVAKMRVYTISDQDDAGPWLRKEFPALFYIASPSDQSSKDYARATWTGISGDRHYKNGPRYRFDLVDNPWLTTHIIENHGPLGELYPKLAYIMEGDTPSFLGLINHGLGWEQAPSYGGWGGRYSLLQVPGETHPIWTNDNATTRDAVMVEDGHIETSDQATIWRWRQHFQNDFAARMNWCVANAFNKANHNPNAVLNGDHSKKVLTFRARSGSKVKLDAKGTDDPDGNAVQLTWWIYSEAGTLEAPANLSSKNGWSTEVRIPRIQKSGTIHVILQVEDDGAPSLVSYRRAVIEVMP